MIGSKPLSDYEVTQMLSELKNNRDKCLFILGLKTGFRISEILSIKASDVTQYGKIRDSITVSRSSMKGKLSSRNVILHPDAKKALEAMVVLTMDKDQKLFPVGRMQAHRILKEAAQRAKIEGKVSSHSMRKSFAKKVYHALGKDLVNTQRAMGHKSIQSTISYLSFEEDKINQAILGG